MDATERAEQMMDDEPELSPQEEAEYLEWLAMVATRARIEHAKKMQARAPRPAKVLPISAGWRPPAA